MLAFAYLLEIDKSSVITQINGGIRCAADLNTMLYNNVLLILLFLVSQKKGVI